MSQEKHPSWLRPVLIILIVIIAFSIWQIFKKDQPETNMDELASDNLYHYRNEDLGFRLSLPAEFIYYQTERSDEESYSEIKFFVPTSDSDYIYETFPSYARPITVRVHDQVVWDKLDEYDENKQDFIKVFNKNSQVYLIKFWDNQPSDWQEQWTEEMKESIRQSFK